MYIIAHQTAEILIIPQVKCPFGNLEMRTCHTFRQLVKERDLDFVEFGSFHDFENIFDFVDEHDFLWAVDLRPVFQEAADYLQNSPLVPYGTNTKGV